MNLDVLKNDEVLASFDFSREIIGEDGQRFTALWEGERTVLFELMTG